MNKSKILKSKIVGKEGLKAFFAILLVLIIGLSLVNTDALILRDKITGDLLAVRRLKKDSYIGIIYKHSVMKTQTSEWYRFEDGKLILMEERFRSYGAGLPAQSKYKFKHDKNGFKLYDINEPFEEVVYRTGAVIANHRLSIDGKVENFLDFSEKREAVAFTVEKLPIVKFLIWRCIYD
ncbi:DUF1850 domain-containing protein [Peptoniphilus catoniae]|uniref:DUF1850 domain-containing protein n=1 Tax=Peptoniphilus catoniae TaxID=1660341 RepID=UPI0010FD6A81|nr:DUF1850 domain-containing protein [Peptoniphilus catoniae]